MTTNQHNQDPASVRFSLLELDGVGGSPAAPQTDADVFKEVTGRDLKERGGTTGQAKADKARAQVAAMPPLADSCKRLAEQIKAEARTTLTAQLSECRISDTGKLYRPGTDKPGIELLSQAYRGIVSRAPRNVPSALRGNVNSWLGRKSCFARDRAKFRVLKRPSGDYAAFACVSANERRGYVEFDADRCAETFARLMPADCKGVTKYQGDGGKWSVEAHIARPFGVGESDREIHRIALRMTGADNGTASLKFDLKAFRLWCANGCAIVDTGLLKRIRHVGNPERLAEGIADALGLVNRAVDSFSARWRLANGERFKCAETGQDLDPHETFTRLAAELVGLPYVRKDEMRERMTTAWDKEPGDSVASIINAVTRMAHEQAEDWASPWYQDDLEQAAGELLYQPVWSLAPVEAAA